MKKTILTLMILNLLFFAIAQEETVQLVSKKGIPILPESGEFSIGISAVPFFEYAGNIFNNTADNASPGFAFIGNQTITGKYMLSNNTAIRGIFRVGFGNSKSIDLVDDDLSTVANVTVEDSWKRSKTDISIGGGLEKRRGKGRLQGIYGGQALFNINSVNDTYEYGNAITATNQTPTRTNYQGLGGALLEDKTALGFNVQVQGFVGAEFFFAPKFSLSGEFSYGVSFSKQGNGSTTTELWDGVNNVVLKETLETGGYSSFGLDTGIGAFLNLNFYF